jgi:phage gpG-like protein
MTAPIQLRSPVDLRAAWPDVARVIANDFGATFASQGKNIGQSWPKLQSRNRRNAATPLVLTGELRSSVADASRGVRKTTKRWLTFGPSDKRYFFVQHAGSNIKRIPARKYIDISARASTEIANIIERTILANASQIMSAIQESTTIGGAV